jgi:hypothetical protein
VSLAAGFEFLPLVDPHLAPGADQSPIASWSKRRRSSAEKGQELGTWQKEVASGWPMSVKAFDPPKTVSVQPDLGTRGAGINPASSPAGAAMLAEPADKTWPRNEFYKLSGLFK